MSRKFIVYCDESGNSGPNYLEKEQPFYVLAGWAVPHDAIVEASVAVERTRQNYSPQRNELKSGTLLKGDKNRFAIVSLLETLGRLGCIPVYMFAEKKYCVAAKIVETFLDPFYNNELNSVFTGDTATKQEIANTLYERLPQDVLERFAMAYREPSANVLRASLNEVIGAAKVLVNPELAAALDGSSTKLKEIAEAEVVAARGWNGLGGTLNFPCLVSFLMLVEHLGRTGFVTTTKLVHDEHRVYQDGFKAIFDMHREAEDEIILVPHGDVPYSGIRHIPEFEIAQSDAQPLVQAADVLAGAVNHICKRLTRGEALTEAEHELGRLVLPPLVYRAARLTWPVCSDLFLKQIGRRIRELFGGEHEASSPETLAMQKAASDAPLLPPHLSPAEWGDETLPRFKVDLPMYGIVGRESSCLMILRVPLGHSGRDSFVVLFTSEEGATDYLESYDPPELTEPHDVRCFGPREAVELVELLERCLAVTSWAAFDLFDDEKRAYVYLPAFVQGMRRSLDRVARTFASGFDKHIIQWHDIGEEPAISMLTSTGDYIAAIPSERETYSGTTREDAVKALMAAKGH
jgi:hypothetical protein